MTTLEEQYNIDVKAIFTQYPEGSEGRAAAKLALWDKFQADKFFRDGDLDAVYKFQAEMAATLCSLVIAYYKGEVPEKEYAPRRSAAFLAYAARMVEFGLASAVPSDAWVAPYTAEALQFERDLFRDNSLGTDPKGLPEAEIIFINDPLRDKCKDILSAFHTEFCTKKLQDTPTVYGGVIDSLREEEQKTAWLKEVPKELPDRRAP